ncbi:MAG: FAD-binding oxidoreductase [Longimicrobiales bacterium]|nr:FAD-binding oxidoreductase [Longimicrobiales bacterium]
MPPAPDHASQLEGELDGDLLEPGDAGFDEARAVWNARFQPKPELIARCASSEDVSRAVRFARDEGLTLSVKGGGHSYAGNTVADEGLLVDLAPLSSVEVDPEARIVTVGAGARWGAVDAATQEHGLATPGGTVSTVGVAGFTLGGGGGWLTRKHGLAADNLRGAEVVTAEGDIVRASQDENADLFWALRGGSGNFGVVTSFELQLHPVGPELMTSQIFFPVERAPELLRFYRDFFRDAPDEVMCYPFFIRIPPLDVFPELFHGKVALDFVLAYLGPVEEADEHLAPFRELRDPFLDLTMPQSYLALQQSFDAGMASGNRWYSRALQFDELSDAAIDTLVQGLDPFPGAFTAVYLAPYSGAPARKAPDATAFPHRSSAHELHIFPGWADESDDADVMAWADAFYEAMAPHGNQRVYVNLLGDGEVERTSEAYAQNLERLRALKAKWDPRNLFRTNHNIEPSG